MHEKAHIDQFKNYKTPLCQLWRVISFENNSNRKWESNSKDETICNEDSNAQDLLNYL